MEDRRLPKNVSSLQTESTPVTKTESTERLYHIHVPGDTQKVAHRVRTAENTGIVGEMICNQ